MLFARNMESPMSKQKENNELGREVMEQIQSGEVTMKPRMYFFVLSGLSVLAVLVMSLTLSFFFSIVILWFRVESATGPAFGARRNLEALVSDFPWWALVFSGVLLCALVMFLRRYSNLYRYRWQTLVLFVILVASVIGFMLSNTNLPNFWNHNSLQNRCQSDGECSPRFNR